MRKINYDKFKEKLSQNPDKITIREGRCQKIINEEGECDYKQKGVDTWLTMDLMRIRMEYPKVNKIIIIACESDFVPTIDYLEKIGIKTVLYTYYEKNRDSSFSTSNELIQTVYKYVLLEKQDFEKAKFD